jgi:hypothetical protein
MTTWPNYESDGRPKRHQRRDRILKRIAAGVATLVFGSVSLVSALMTFHVTPCDFCDGTETTVTTTTYNGVSHTTTSVIRTAPHELWWFGMVAMGFFAACCLVVAIWPDEA